MVLKKKKNVGKKHGILDKLDKLYPELNRGDIIVAFPYNLKLDEADTRCDGIVVADRKRLVSFCNGERIFEVNIAEIAAINVDVGVGSCSVSYVLALDNSHHMLCRCDMSVSKQAIKASKQFNRIVETTGIDNCKASSFYGKNNLGDISDAVKKCPKCGRILQGNQICVHCTSKLRTVKRLWNMVKPYKAFIITAVVFFAIVTALNLVLPEINRIVTDDYINAASGNISVNGLRLPEYVLIIVSMLLVQAVIRAFSMLRSHLLIQASNKMIIDLRNTLFEKIQRLSISKISKRTAGELMRRVSHDVRMIQDFLVNYLPSLIEQMLMFVAIGIVFITEGMSVLLLLILIPVPLVVLGFSLFWNKVHRLFQRCWQNESRSNSILHDIFSGIRVVKSFGMEHRETERYDKAVSEEREMQMRADTLWYTLMPIMQFFMCFGEFIILFYVGNQILGGNMTLGEMSKFSMYGSMIYSPLRMLSSLPRQIINCITSTAKVFEIMDEEEDVADSAQAVDTVLKGDIDINHVSFGYDSGKEVLTNIDIHIKSGEFIGLVGRSGVGKSTLINLIMRMYDVEDGSICIDGIDIRDISQETLRSQMGVVLQETFLFAGTIYQNIAYARPEATRDEVIAVSKLAGCHDFIIKLIDGYDTKIGEKGYSLSGGERQRIAIARALLRNPKILILDEATASLDTETEKQIQDALQALSENRTTIAIAHRLSTLRNATRLIVLDKGRIAEIGTHDELVEKKGIYYGLVMAQREMSKMS